MGRRARERAKLLGRVQELRHALTETRIEKQKAEIRAARAEGQIEVYRRLVPTPSTTEIRERAAAGREFQ